MSLDAPAAAAIDGRRLSFAIAAARFNPELVDALLERVLAGLARAGVRPARIRVERVPGSHEVPFAIDALLRRGTFDCGIALGVLIAGATQHHEMVGTSVSHALQRIGVERRRPVINGVVVADTRRQAEERCRGRIDRGAEFAHAALEMALLARRLRSRTS
jgi:6,7-dimethyl-8-ribityllumazine synthase